MLLSVPNRSACLDNMHKCILQIGVYHPDEPVYMHEKYEIVFGVLDTMHKLIITYRKRSLS